MARSRMADRPDQKAVLGTSTSNVRIDQPHRSASAGNPVGSAHTEPEDTSADATDGILLGQAEEKVLAQAAQLASIVQTRLKDLDRREANLHAARAQFESESRSLRLAFQEREATLHEGESNFEQKMTEWRERFQTQIEREERLCELEDELQAREKQSREEAAGLELARRTFQVERDEFSQQTQTERSSFQQQMQEETQALEERVRRETETFEERMRTEKESFEQQMQEERDALLHEIELTRTQDRERAEKQQMELMAEMERQRQELFAEREQFDKAQSAFEQERAMWVVARTGGTQDAFDLAQDRMQLEKDRQEFLDERHSFEAQRREWIAELERRQLEIDRLKKALANGNFEAGTGSEIYGEDEMSAADFMPITRPDNERATDALAAISDAHDADGGLPFSCLSVDEQRQRLEEAADYLAREAEDLDRERQMLADVQLRWKERARQQQDEIQRRTAALEAELENRQSKLSARERQVDQQLTSVEQTRQEILKVHRESLEMRLVAEELWAQVSGKVPAAEASQAIAKLRNRLAGQFKVENQQLAAKKQQILELAERLNEQYEAVMRQRRELQSWGAAQQLEIEQQAERLVRRELELDEQQQLLEQREGDWAKEVRRLQQQIHRQTVKAG